MSAGNQISIPSLSFHNILFALDFSPGSLLALPFAAHVAAHYRSKLFISHIDENQSHSLTSQAALEKLEASAENGLFDTLGALKEMPHEFLFNHGSICSTLIAVAGECKVDLIVLGTHGWRGIKKLLKGSTAEEIAFLATRPVLIVGPKVESQPEFKHILFATDVSQASALALLYAFSFAHAYEASAVALHVGSG
jgi:nucleotide-binding universal stress UspA family protein